MASLVGQPSIKGRSEATRMILLNFCTIGITQPSPPLLHVYPKRLLSDRPPALVDCTPYLLNLGLTKSNTSLIWIAGPLSGLLVQPIIGVISDENTSKWGRRRPFMVIGALIVSVCLIILGFTKEIVEFVLPDEELAKGPTIALAVLSIYALDFAINAVMSCSRSLIVDTLPLEKQQAGAAWASRMNAVGHVVGYGAGAIDLVQILGNTLGQTQFQQLTLIAAMAILATTATTCWAVRESVLVSSKGSKPQSSYGVLGQIYSTLRHLPPRIEAICWAQFWSWIGWFPFLFYSTTWVGEIYFRYDIPADARQSEDILGEMGRIGSKSLVMYSFITCTGSFVMPLFVKSPDEEPYTARPPQAVAGFLKRFEDMKPDLLSTWIFGHIMFAASMSLAPFATSFRFATTLVCLCGLPWTIAMWAPTALLGIEVNKLSGRTGNRRLSNDTDTELRELNNRKAPTLLGDGPETPASSSGELSGIYFGILNIYTTIPQFLGTLLATVVFAILEPGKSRELGNPGQAPGRDGPNAIAVCLFVGAVCAVVASFATRRLKSL
ncbi:sucrose transport protein, partial [Metarhizium brunneum ARSEF 3297]